MFREIVIIDAKVKNLILKSFNPWIYGFDKRYDIGLYVILTFHFKMKYLQVQSYFDWQIIDSFLC